MKDAKENPIGVDDYKEVFKESYFPNREVKEAFQYEIKAKFIPDSGVNAYYSLKGAFERGDPIPIRSYLEETVLSCFSYYDFGEEKNYQIMVLAITGLLSRGSIVKSEVISGTGRCDILVLPKEEGKFGMEQGKRNISGRFVPK